MLAQTHGRLGTAVIQHSANADYAYRLFVEKSVWATVLSSLAADIDYDNFKSEVARPPEATSAGGLPPRARALYEDSLHDVWEMMFRLQRRSVARPARSSDPGTGRGRP